MQSVLVCSIKVLVVFHIFALGMAQAQTHPNQTNCGQAGGGLKQQDVKRIQASDQGPIGVALCDGTIYTGDISEMNSDSFTLKTDKNQFVRINYTFVKEIGLKRYV